MELILKKCSIPGASTFSHHNIVSGIGTWYQYQLQWWRQKNDDIGQLVHSPCMKDMTRELLWLSNMPSREVQCEHGLNEYFLHVKYSITWQPGLLAIYTRQHWSCRELSRKLLKVIFLFINGWLHLSKLILLAVLLYFLPQPSTAGCHPFFTITYLIVNFITNLILLLLFAATLCTVPMQMSSVLQLLLMPLDCCFMILWNFAVTIAVTIYYAK